MWYSSRTEGKRDELPVQDCNNWQISISASHGSALRRVIWCLGCECVVVLRVGESELPLQVGPLPVRVLMMGPGSAPVMTDWRRDRTGKVNAARSILLTRARV